jgi:hypothetical protein
MVVALERLDDDPYIPTSLNLSLDQPDKNSAYCPISVALLSTYHTAGHQCYWHSEHQRSK